MMNTEVGMVMPLLTTPRRSERRMRLPRGMPFMSNMKASIHCTTGLASRKAWASSVVSLVLVMM